MPYVTRKNDDGEFCVYKTSGGDTLGCHETRSEAQRQIAALYANEPKAKTGG